MTNGLSLSGDIEDDGFDICEVDMEKIAIWSNGIWKLSHIRIWIGRFFQKKLFL